MSIFLKSSDSDELVEVNIDVLKMSLTIKNMIEDFGESAGTEKAPIPVSSVNHRDLCKAMEFCKYHHENDVKVEEGEEEKEEDTKKKEFSAWDIEFCNIPQSELFSLINATNFLDIKPLLDVACYTVAMMIKGKKVEEIRKIFNIKNDFTEEEEKEIRKKNEWLTGKS